MHKLIGAMTAGLMLMGATQTVAQTQTQTQNLTNDRYVFKFKDSWKFKQGDIAGAEALVIDDKDWTEVRLPHTYSLDSLGEGGDLNRHGEPYGVYYRGPAWYRFKMDVGHPSGKRFFMHFGGVPLAADVFINGKKVGRHEGGYAAFRLDVTDYLRASPNTFAVRVDNTKLPHVAPLNGDFNIFGGLTREVNLITVPNVHIDLMDFGGPGVYVDTQAIGKGTAHVRARVHVKNDDAAQKSVEVVTRILDADGKTVATQTQTQTFAAGIGNVVEFNYNLKNPKLWEGRKSPYLYKVVAEVNDRAAGTQDSLSVPLGIRTVSVEKDGTFLLNGKPYKVYGANMQLPTRPERGTMVTDAEIDEDMQILYEMGSTGVRLAHVQHPQRVYEKANELGLLISTESPLVDDMDNSDAFRENLVQQMTELVVQNYNHPSVVVWGLGNELRTSGDKANQLLAALQSAAKTRDPLRPTAYAHCCLSDDDPIAKHSDTVSYNRYFGWYWDKFEDIGTWADELHKNHPDLIIGVSEYGAGASVLHQEDPAQKPYFNGFWHPEQYQTAYHEAYWRILRDKPYLWSNFIWVAYDFPSFKRNEGDRPGINDKGIITEDRKIRKDAYYWYQANWSEEPMLYITSRRDVHKRNKWPKVKVYSNQGEISLSHNGKVLETKKVDDFTAIWDIELVHGVNEVIATTKTKDGRTLTDKVVWNYGNFQPR